LVDCDGFQIVILVILESFALHHFDKIYVGKYIMIINFSCGATSKYAHGDSPHVIKITLSSTKIMEIVTFPIQIMFMLRDLNAKFVTRKMYHVVACISIVVIQVHGHVNYKYEFLVTNGTKLEDIKTFSLWK
jgi:hypothetical protein